MSTGKLMPLVICDRSSGAGFGFGGAGFRSGLGLGVRLGMSALSLTLRKWQLLALLVLKCVTAHLGKIAYTHGM